MKFPLWCGFVAALWAAGCASNAAGAVVAAPRASQSAPEPKLAATRADGDLHYQRNEWQAALDVYLRELARTPEDLELLDRVAHCEHLLGRFEQSLAAWSELARKRPRNPTPHYNVACAHARLGQREPAFAALERALGNGFKNLEVFENDPDLASLREDPRLAALLERARAGAQPNARPPAELAQFAFWVGEWDVFGAQGGRAGTSRVERILDGFVLLENWTGSDGLSGKSFNTFDPARARWRQHWVDNRGNVLEFREGQFENGVLTFHASWPQPDGTTFRRRMSFTDLGAEGVRQHSERSADDGQHWTEEYELFYRRRAQD